MASTQTQKTKQVIITPRDLLELWAGGFVKVAPIIKIRDRQEQRRPALAGLSGVIENRRRFSFVRSEPEAAVRRCSCHLLAAHYCTYFKFRRKPTTAPFFRQPGFCLHLTDSGTLIALEYNAGGLNHFF